jgi:hypothetical protein
MKVYLNFHYTRQTNESKTQIARKSCELSHNLETDFPNYGVHNKNDAHLSFCCYLFFIGVVRYTISTASLGNR